MTKAHHLKVDVVVAYCLSALACCVGQTTSADLVVSITEGVGGTSVIDVRGNGSITANSVGSLGGLLNIATLDDTFLVPDTPFLQDLSFSPAMTLGGQTNTRVFVQDFNAGSLSEPVNSRLGFGRFDGQFTTGDDASDLNGTYLASIPYSVFVPGVYEAQLAFTTDFAAVTDIGAITVSVGQIVPIPEISPVSLTGLGMAAAGLRRRKQKSFARLGRGGWLGTEPVGGTPSV